MACCRLCDHFPGIPIVIRFGGFSALRHTAVRTFARLNALFHTGGLRRSKPCAEFVIRLGNRFCLRHTALRTLPLLDAGLHAGGLRRSKPCAEAVPLGGRRGGPPIRAAVVADKFGISRRGACSKYSLPDDPEVTRGRFCGAPLARRAIPAVGVVFSCRGAGRLFCIVLIPAVARCRRELWIPLVACTAIGSLRAGLCTGRFFTLNNFPRSKAVGHGRVSLISASHPTDGTFQYIVSSPQAGWLFLIGLYNVFMMFRITVFRRARKRGNRGQRRHERKYQKY